MTDQAETTPHRKSNTDETGSGPMLPSSKADSIKGKYAAGTTMTSLVNALVWPDLRLTADRHLFIDFGQPPPSQLQPYRRVSVDEIPDVEIVEPEPRKFADSSELDLRFEPLQGE